VHRKQIASDESQHGALIGRNDDNGYRAAHGYAETREAAMAGVREELAAGITQIGNLNEKTASRFGGIA
jgi:hypothetical protein